jgi:hypothetical protein
MTWAGKVGGWAKPFAAGLIDRYVAKRVKAFYAGT